MSVPVLRRYSNERKPKAHFELLMTVEDKDMSQKKTSSPWMWIGCGCGVIVLILGVAIGGAGYFGVKKAKEFGESMTDPVKREERVLEILGADTLPPDLHAMFGFSIPFVLEVALLSDLPPDDSGEPQNFGEAGMVYTEIRGGMGNDVDEVRDYFEGVTDDVSVLRDNDINIRVDEVLERGVIERSDMELMWVSQRGDVAAMGNGSDDTITAMMFMDCPNDEKLRIAIWFKNDDESDIATADRDFAGTPADPVEIERFSQYLRPCGD